MSRDFLGRRIWAGMGGYNKKNCEAILPFFGALRGVPVDGVADSLDEA